MTRPGCLGNPFVRARLSTENRLMRFVLYRVECARKTSVDKREDGAGIAIMRENWKVETKEARDPRVTLRAERVINFSSVLGKNRIDNVSRPDAVRGPHAEGIEARNSHSFAAHRKRGGRSKNRVRRRVGGLAVVKWFIYRRDNSEEDGQR